ncbi:MAG: single-stranded DNA-binding protein [Micromonosporaceae bacterium]
MNEMQVALSGYVASVPKLGQTKAGRFVTNMRVGVTPRRLDRETGQWSDGDTSYMTVTCWRGLASNVAACLRKGDPVVVKGKMRVREYEDKEGKTRTVVEVDASTIGHDLTRGVAHFVRTKRSPGDAPAAGEQPDAGWAAEPPEELEPEDIPDGEFAGADMFDDAGVEASSLQFAASGAMNGSDGPDGADGMSPTGEAGADAGTRSDAAPGRDVAGAPRSDRAA